MLRIDDDAVLVIDWAPVPSLRRTKHKTLHGVHEYATLARIRDWGNRRHGGGRRLRSGHRFSVRRRRRRKREPTDRGTTAAPTATARARTTPTPALEQRSATPEHEQSDRDVHGERQGGRRPFPPLRERERVAVEDWSRSGRHDL